MVWNFAFTSKHNFLFRQIRPPNNYTLNAHISNFALLTALQGKSFSAITARCKFQIVATNNQY